MKLKLFILIVVVSFIFIGCNKVEQISPMEEGKNALENKDYKVALEIFEKELNENGGNKEVRDMYIQAKKMMQVMELKEANENRDALKIATSLDGIDGVLESVKKHVKELENELIGLVQHESDEENNRKVVAQTVVAGAVSRSEREQRQLAEKARQEEVKKKEELEKQEETENKVEGNQPNFK